MTIPKVVHEVAFVLVVVAATGFLGAACSADSISAPRLRLNNCDSGPVQLSPSSSMLRSQGNGTVNVPARPVLNEECDCEEEPQYNRISAPGSASYNYEDCSTPEGCWAPWILFNGYENCRYYSEYEKRDFLFYSSMKFKTSPGHATCNSLSAQLDISFSDPDRYISVYRENDGVNARADTHDSMLFNENYIDTNYDLWNSTDPEDQIFGIYQMTRTMMHEARHNIGHSHNTGSLPVIWVEGPWSTDSAMMADCYSGAMPT